MNGDFCLHMRDNYIKLGKTPRKIGIRLFSENILTTYCTKVSRNLLSGLWGVVLEKKTQKKTLMFYWMTDKQVKNN